MSDRFLCAGVAVAPQEGRISGRRGERHLRPRSMEVLWALAERAGEVVAKRALLDRVWRDASVSEAVLTNAVSELRRAFAAVGGERELVETVPRRGYRLTAAVAFEHPRPDPARSLAVLPFENLSPEGPSAALLTALHDAMIHELARLPGFRVLPRTATVPFRPGVGALARLGHELLVDRVVTGTAVTNGARLRIGVQLVDLAAERVLWSTSLIVILGDPIELPAALARALAPELARALGDALPPTSPGASIDPRTAELFLRGQFHLRGSTVARLEQGLADLVEVARREPDLAAGFAGQARGLFLLASWGADPDGHRRARAEAAAAKALVLEPESLEAQVWWHMAHAFGRLRVADALVPLARLVRDHPQSPEARDALAHCLAIVGRLSEAIDEERRALAGDPLSPALRAALGFFLRSAGAFDEAAAVLTDALELHPDWTIARLELARVDWARGDRAAAARELAAVDPDWGAFATALVDGRRRTVLRALARWSATPELGPYWLAERCVWAEERERALEALERAFAERQLRLLYAACDSTFAPLRGEPRFRRLLARLGLASAEP